MSDCNTNVPVAFDGNKISYPGPSGGNVVVNSQEMICFELVAAPGAFFSAFMITNQEDFKTTFSDDKRTIYVVDKDSEAGDFSYTIGVENGGKVFTSDPQIVNHPE